MTSLLNWYIWGAIALGHGVLIGYVIWSGKFEEPDLGGKK